ncbi:hypothetical protein H9649_12080 [Sporosarcina sp. Sa2YVA2]|uniref:Uncharacterized protein n=1 Tax=Sporosarcina quadrami TaxID=2762234 RepID=A0ABR8UBC0_9BACL|nr:hypothetical protein [Sporosarcina quadrami]MBD7985328.1 hypothetical protein [Sporosarcina quadrami]
MDEKKVVVLLYEDNNLVDEKLLFRGMKSELVTLIGNERVLKESGGIFTMPVDGVDTELRIEKSIIDYEGTDEAKYIFYQVVRNK